MKIPVINQEKKENAEESKEGELFFLPSMDAEIKSRITGIYGEVTEDCCKTAITALYYFRDIEYPDDGVPQEGEEDVEEINPPIEFIISTEGGSVQDMFSVYDCVRDIKKDCEINTFGIGKVMSAGVLLLAMGTPGKRRIGKHCRLMLHAVSGGQFGSLKELEVDIKEVKWYQKQFIEALASETKLTEKKIREIFRKKTDTYFDAEQAVEWGIADEVV